MIPSRTLLAVTLVLNLCNSAAAGPCTAEIVKIQAKVDAALDRKAGAGKTGSESVAATAHHQPTPETIAAAERALGEGASIRRALDALATGRVADARGDAEGCRAAIANAHKALKN
jgi:hypothetical protein